MLPQVTSFQGTMRIKGDGGPPVPVNARIGDDRLVLEVDGVAVGEWPVDGVSPQVDGGGVNLRLGEDQVQIDVTNRIAFVTALVPRTAEKPARKRRRQPSPLLVGLALGAAAIVTAAVMFPDVVGSIMMLAGLVVLVTGAMAYSEPRIALRLPLNLQAIHFVMVGLLFLAFGVFLVLVA